MDTTLATSVQILDRLMRRCGIDAEATFARHGIERALIHDPSARLPRDGLDAVLADLADRIHDPAFGLRAAECWHPSQLGALGHAWLVSSTLRRGLERVQRYWRLLGQRSSLVLRDDADGLAIVMQDAPRDPSIAAIVTDVHFSVLLAMCRFNLEPSFAPVRVRMVRPQPADRAPYDRFYGCAVAFGQDERSLTLPAAVVDATLPTANRNLAGLLDRVLAEELARLDRTNVVARCRALLLERLAGGEVTATEAARRLAMSRRTLHRKLADEGTTWQQLVDETRRDIAMRMIEDPRRPIGEITFELGFSQQSAFARAFRRWAGTSPTQYRASLPAARARAQSA